MSAYLCSPETLAVVALASIRHSSESHPMAAELLFNELLDVNLQSLAARYPESARIQDWDSRGEGAYTFALIDLDKLPTSAEYALSAVGEYQYQSCEHDGWQGCAIEELTTSLKGLLAPLAKAEAVEAGKVASAKRQAFYAAHPTASAKDSAALLRKALKDAFPAAKISLRMSRGTGYGYMYCSWTDGPSEKSVRAITDPFHGERFDGMTDSSESLDSIMPNDPQQRCSGLKSVSLTRNISPAFARLLVAQVGTYYGAKAWPVVRTNSYDGSFEIDSTLAYADVNGDPKCSTSSPYTWYASIRQASEDRTRFSFDR